MSVWLVPSPPAGHQDSGEFVLPFAGLPDLSHVAGEADMRRLVALLHTDWPPERITRDAERHWHVFGTLAPEDLLVMPVDGRFALVEITGPYRYRTQGGEDVHTVPIRWLDTAIPARKLSQLSPLLPVQAPLVLLEWPEQRKQVYALLKKPYNRFVKWRWILGVVIALQVIAMLLRMLEN